MQIIARDERAAFIVDVFGGIVQPLIGEQQHGERTPALSQALEQRAVRQVEVGDHRAIRARVDGLEARELEASGQLRSEQVAQPVDLPLELGRSKDSHRRGTACVVRLGRTRLCTP